MPGSPRVNTLGVGSATGSKPMDMFQRIFPWVVMAYLGWFAWHFAVERLHMDAAYFLLRIVDNGVPYVTNGRWVIPLAQWPAVVGVQLGLPLGTIIGLFSLGNIVILIGSILFVTRALRDHTAGITMVALQFVGLAHALFCPVFELYYGATLLIAFVATLRTDRVLLWRSVILAILFVLVVSCHFMGMAIMLMVLVLEQVWKDRRLALLLLLLLALHLWSRLYFLSIYEQDALRTVVDRLRNDGVSWLFSQGRLIAVAVDAKSTYPDTSVIAVLTTVVMIVRNDRFGLLVFLCGLLALYVALGLYFPDGTRMIYREIVDYPVTVWVVLVLWRRVLAKGHARDLVMGVLVLAFAFRVAYPLWIARTYTARTEWMRNLIGEAHERGIGRGLVFAVPKFIPPDGGHPLPGLDPIQAMLISAREGPERTVELVPSAPGDTAYGFEQRWDTERKKHRIRLPQGSVYFDMPQGPFSRMR